MMPRREYWQRSAARKARLAALAVAMALTLPGGPVLAQAVVQQVPGGATLSAALARLARDPRDLAALIDAGKAALVMGDVDAAIGFFARADQLSPNNMQVKAGLAGALVRSENPYDAIPLFAEAERGGGLDPLLLADRGLAYDLVGDNATAQKYYRQSLASAAHDETRRRLALSQAMAGDRPGMEQTLSSLLQRQDKAAWRVRAFALAILGRPDEAVGIASQTMPVELAGGIAPYLRYMAKLTPAQQAAAANFGRFPRAAEIGHDDPRVALYAQPRRAQTADAGLVPAGRPLGSKARQPARDSRRGKGEGTVAALAPAVPQPSRSAPPEPMPGRQVTAIGPAVAPAAARPAAAPAVQRPVAPAIATAAGASGLARVATAQAAPAAGARPLAPPPAPAPVTAVQTVPRQPVAPPSVVNAAPAKPAVQAPRQPRVADAFADFTLPAGAAAPAPGAVDVRKLKPKPKAPEVEKVPPKPVHPSRIWVQVGTGRDPKALGFTWRALAKDNADLFRGKTAATSDWGRTNRLLTGPFASEAAAGAFLARLKKAGVDAFLWTSPVGQVVDDL